MYIYIYIERDKKERIKDLSVDIPSDDRNAAVEDFACGVSFLAFGLQVKMQFWKLLPWHIVGMAHWDLEVARDCARRCVALFDDGGAAGVGSATEIASNSALAHPKSQLFLDPRGPLRGLLLVTIC